MKNSNLKRLCFMLTALLCLSCSREENSAIQTGEKVQLNFNTVILDLGNRSSGMKQSISDIPDCSDDTPFFVEIILMQGNDEMLGDPSAPFRVDLANGQMFTKNVPELQLPPGTYGLDHFAVYNEAGTLLWLAPKTGGDMAAYSDDPLPMNIELMAGTKPYMDVPVMCYDNRDVNEYGYLFFELDTIPLFPYCFFANYCDDNGRHYPARFSVEISIGENILYSEEINHTGVNGSGENYADPLCLVLPDLEIYDDDEEYIDYTLKLLDWEGVYSAEEEIEISGSLSREDIEDQFEGEENVEYEHIFFNCEEGTSEPPETLPDVEEAVFSDPTNITNPYYGPPAGHIYQYEGFELEDGEIPEEPSEVIFIERKTETKVVMGITTIIQRDYVMEDGVIIEDTDDWLAQDDDGNLWYFGEDSKNYDEEGNFIDNEGSWEAGADGALPGYWLPGDPFVGQIYYQEWYAGDAEDYAEVISLDETLVTDMGSFENVLVTRDVNPFEEDVYELKYYAPGIGLILEEKYEEGELVEVVYLTGIIVID